MTSTAAPCYRFVTRDQRRTLFEAGISEKLILDPATGDESRDIRDDAVSITIAPDGSFVWMDECGRLFGSGCADPIELGSASPARLVSSGDRIWVLMARNSLLQLDASTFQLLFRQDAEEITDIAPDDEGGVWLLARAHINRLMDGATNPRSYPDLRRPCLQIAVAGDALGALSEDATSLFIRKPGNSEGFALDLKTILGDDWLGKQTSLSSSREAFILSAANCATFAVIDPDGNLALQGRWRGDRKAKLLTAHHDSLFALFDDDGRNVLKRFCGLTRRGGKRILTPALETESPTGSWLRAEIEATLPEGATLAVRWAATNDANLARRIGKVLADKTLPESERLYQADLLWQWNGEKNPTFTYVGVARDPLVPDPVQPERFTLPLHAAGGPILWVDIRLLSNGREVEPTFLSLIVFHDAESLMDMLPAIYRGDGDRDGTLRRLVGVLEATTQGLDRGIGRLAERLDPERTNEKWLGELAAMLGLPFHESLPSQMKRRIVTAAAPIIAGRGTRKGLLALLRTLFAGRPVRVIDLAEQLTPLALDGGTRLPALLTGPSRRVPKLNARLILSKTPMCMADACNETSVTAPPQVMVVVAATRRERSQYSEAIHSLIHEMLPVGVQLRMKWTGWAGSGQIENDDVLAVVDAPDELTLGSGPMLGRARTGGRQSARLDSAGAVPAEHRIL